MNFIQNIAMALLSCIHLASYAIDSKPKVVVVGAGLAGLTTAFHLHQAGVDVEVYEARNRVGGRIHSILVNGTVVELGGQNILDCGEHTNVINLLDTLNLESIHSRFNLHHGYYAHNKNVVPIKTILQKQGWSEESLKEDLYNIAQKAHSMHDVIEMLFTHDNPLYTLSRTRLAAYEGGVPEDLSTAYIDTLYHVLSGGICSAHQDTNYLEHLSIKGGNSLLPEALAKVLGAKVHVGMPLKAVAKETSGAYRLTFENGYQTDASILVLAIPCSVYDAINFQEGVLPSKTLRSIKQIRYGQNSKIVIPIHKSKQEIQHCINDYMVSFINEGGNMLHLYYIGESSHFSAHTIEGLYQKSKQDLHIAFASKVFPSLGPVLAYDEPLGCYEGPVGHSWPNDPYARGSYAYIAPGQEALLKAVDEEEGQPVKTLFTSIDQTLYFAGEHTSVLFDVPGTMEAACESGKRIAHIIVKRLSQKGTL